ncbi:MAG: thioredoxin domain-containing protein, partial [Solirubrobacterales bacterium]
PYLRQHAENPVDWLPWGPVALARARAQDKPLLVSIGYSSCHWCHVMERESFEDPRTAELMNESFVCVKVDREERPDVDALYMEAVQGMTGRGGWPLNVFLTPEQLPFYGGTYFPPDPRPGMPAWTQVLQAIAESWSERHEEIRAGGERLRERLAGGALLSPSSEPIRAVALDQAVAKLAESFDAQHGGFGRAPKFPQASVIEFLLLRGERSMTLGTLRAMARGGIHDLLGGGFARYSVDDTWTVPHFEKMLYDNALLARAYLHGWQAFGERDLLEACLDTLGWALREMRGPEGGFYSALDADSEGVEGRFYVWTVAELKEVLGQDAAAAIAWFGASEQGNFEDPHHPVPGLNVLEDRGPRPDQATRARIRKRLLQARSARVRPGLDDKRLTAWNALMICALAETGAHLREEPVAGAPSTEAQALLQAAAQCAEFVLRELRDERGRLLRTYSHGSGRIDAYLEDHAFLLEAMIVLFEATCHERWFQEATALAGEMIARFSDPEWGGFFSTASDQEPLIARRKDLEDTPIPAGSSSAALGLLRLAQLTGERDYERHAVSVLRLLHEIAPRHPAAFGHLLQALHWHLSPARPIACLLPSDLDGRPHPAAARQGGGPSKLTATGSTGSDRAPTA